MTKGYTNHQFPCRKDRFYTGKILSSCETVLLWFPDFRRLVQSLFICTWLLHSGLQLSSDPLLGHVQALTKPVRTFPLISDHAWKMKIVKYVSKLKKKVNMSSKSGKTEKNELEFFCHFTGYLLLLSYLRNRTNFCKNVGDFWHKFEKCKQCKLNFTGFHTFLHFCF